MDLIADGLLVAGALGAAFYCFVLSRRLTRFNDLENGVGGAVAVLSAQVDDLTKALDRARRGADRETEKLAELTERAEAAAKQLELMMAAMHDLPEAPPSTARPTAPASSAAPHTARPPSPAPQSAPSRPTAAPSARVDPEPAEAAFVHRAEAPLKQQRPAEPVFSRSTRRA